MASHENTDLSSGVTPSTPEVDFTLDYYKDKHDPSQDTISFKSNRASEPGYFKRSESGVVDKGDLILAKYQGRRDENTKVTVYKPVSTSPSKGDRESTRPDWSIDHNNNFYIDNKPYTLWCITHLQLGRMSSKHGPPGLPDGSFAFGHAANGSDEKDRLYVFLPLRDLTPSTSPTDIPSINIESWV